MSENGSTAVDLFRELLEANTSNDVIKLFRALCQEVDVDPRNTQNIYNIVKSKIVCSESTKFYKLIDARANQDVYGNGKICKSAKILVIGGGPCGLRAAIECALLGAHVVVVEKRGYVTRNNVLHLWPTAANDLKAIGAKVFYPKFCAGALHHVSIRRLQLVLMKIALLLGVEVYAPVVFESLIPPDPNRGSRWRAQVSCPKLPDSSQQTDCPVNKMEFNVVIGADGKQNSLDFPRKFTRGKVSIAITANFKNPATGMHTRVSEIPGVISIKRPDLFSELTEKSGLEFENFVYFRDETHYFIMTAKKKSILERGIVKKENADLRAMFSPNNVDTEKLHKTVKTLAHTAWRVDNPSFTELPELEFVKDRYGKDDVAIFDFAALHQAEHSVMIKERHGQKILMCIVGDTLLEPFWPTGSGIAKGFLGTLDAVWTIRNYFKGSMTDLEVLAERESIFRVLPQVTPDNLSKDINKCNIDPKTRYTGTHYGGRLPLDTVKPKDVEHLYNTSEAMKRKSCGFTVQDIPSEKRRLYRGGSIDTHRLVGWFKEKLSQFNHIVKVSDLAKSWNNGLALCALIQTERPDLMNVECLDRNDCRGNIEKAFDMIECEFGVEQMMSPDDLAYNNNPDKLTMMSYLFHIYEYIITKDEPKEGKVPKMETGTSSTDTKSAYSLLTTFANSAALLRTLQHDAQRIHDLDLNTLARSASKSSHHGESINYFLKTASLDRRSRNKVHLAVRRSKSIKPEQVVRKWRKKTQDAKRQRRQGAYEQHAPSKNADQDSGKPTSRPPLEKSGSRKKIPLQDQSHHSIHNQDQGETNKRILRQDSDGQEMKDKKRGVTFSEDAREQDGPVNERTEEEQDKMDKAMSLSRQACSGVAANRIKAFMTKEEEESKSRSPSLKRKQAFRNNSQKGTETLKRTGEICCICNKRLYIVERYSAQGFFLHRHCFKCSHCNTHLRVGNYVNILDNDGNPHFYCAAHAYQGGTEWNEVEDTPDMKDSTLKAGETPGDHFSRPLTEEERSSYMASDDEDDYSEDEDTLSEGEDDDDGYEHLHNLPNAEEALTLRRILKDLDQKNKEALTEGEINDLGSDVSDVTDTSAQLLQQEEIQQGLDDIEQEREELEEKGVLLEKQIRGDEGDRYTTNVADDLLNGWLDVARKKQELKEKESKLMLQLRLMDLQERLKAMLDLMAIADDSTTDKLQEDVEEIEAVTEKMEQAAMKEDLSEMMQHMKQMKQYLQRNASRTEC